MKKMRIGILGKTLLFTFLLVLAVSRFYRSCFFPRNFCDMPKKIMRSNEPTKKHSLFLI